VEKVIQFFQSLSDDQFKFFSFTMNAILDELSCSRRAAPQLRNTQILPGAHFSIQKAHPRIQSHIYKLGSNLGDYLKQLLSSTQRFAAIQLLLAGVMMIMLLLGFIASKINVSQVSRSHQRTHFALHNFPCVTTTSTTLELQGGTFLY
jgi:hypothetical protein